MSLIPYTSREGREIVLYVILPMPLSVALLAVSHRLSTIRVLTKPPQLSGAIVMP